MSFNHSTHTHITSVDIEIFFSNNQFALIFYILFAPTENHFAFWNNLCLVFDSYIVFVLSVHPVESEFRIGNETKN